MIFSVVVVVMVVAFIRGSAVVEGRFVAAEVVKDAFVRLVIEVVEGFDVDVVDGPCPCVITVSNNNTIRKAYDSGP